MENLTEKTTMEDSYLSEINKDKIKEYSPAIAFSAVVVFFGIFGNILSTMFYGFKTKKSVTNTFITALAITDLITCAVLSDEIIELSYTVTFRSVFGCKLMYFCNHWLVFCSGFQLVLIAIDRYRRICKPLSRQFSIFSARVAIAGVIVGALLVSIRDWVILDVVRVEIRSHNYNETLQAYYCTHSNVKGGMQIAVKTFHLIDLTLFVVLISSIVVLYGFVAKAIWSARYRTKKYSQNIQCATISDSSGETNDRPSSVSDQETNTSDISNTDNDIPTNTAKQPSKRYFQTSHREIINECRGDTKENSNSTEEQEVNTTPTSDEGHNDKLNIISKENIKPPRRAKIPKTHHHHSYHGERKIAIMMMVITFASILSFVPYFIVNLTVKANSTTSEQEFNVGIQIALRSYMLNNAINPYLMGIFNTEFKLFVKRLLCKCF